MRRRVQRGAAILSLLPLLSGCAIGRIYNHTTLPLSLNFERTPSGIVGGKTGDENIKHFSYRVDVLWDTNAIGDAAKAGGLTTVHYADLETLSVLGIWNQYWLHVYGE